MPQSNQDASASPRAADTATRPAQPETGAEPAKPGLGAARSGAVTLVKGFCMGAADVVPGVSGGTMAVILGIYDRLLRAIRSFGWDWLVALARWRIRAALTAPDLPFLVPLVLGIGAALFFFTRVVPLPDLLVTHPEPVYGLFFGLILASALLLATRGGWRWLDGPALILGAVGGWWLVQAVPVALPATPLLLLMAGFLSLGAMLLPGISGSFVLLILGFYDTVFRAIGSLDFSVLLPFALGAVLALILLSRLFAWLLAHFERPALKVIAGLLAGSLWVIWPFQVRVPAPDGEGTVARGPVWPEVWDGERGLVVILAVAGMALVFLLHHWASRGRPAE